MAAAVAAAVQSVIFGEEGDGRSTGLPLGVRAEGSLKSAVALLHSKAMLFQLGADKSQRLELFKAQFRIVVNVFGQRANLLRDRVDGLCDLTFFLFHVQGSFLSRLPVFLRP